MKALFRSADAFLAQATWRDLALAKLCLCAVGVLLGLAAPRRARKWWALGAVAVFTATYLPLMRRYLPILGRAVGGKTSS